MSNQTKIGLLLGLGVILLVGIIVSDHLATQSQNHITDSGLAVAPLAELNNTNQQTGIRNRFLSTAPAPAHEVAFVNPQAGPSTQLPSIMLDSPAPQPLTVPTPGAPTPGTAVAVGTPGLATPPSATAVVPVNMTTNLVMPNVVPQNLVVPPPAKTPRTYTIKEGDTLSSIAAATLGSRNRWKDLLDANAKTLGNAKGLKIGTVITLPESEAKVTPPVAAPPAGLLPTPKPARTYTVGKGDLLGSIAAKTMGSTKKVKELVSANRKVLPQGEKTILKTGMVLTIPAQ